MNAITYLQHLHLAYLSKPSGDRPIYKVMRRLQPRRIVELGIGDGERMGRLATLALQLVEGDISYTGADMFEGRDDQPHLTLKTAHQRLADERIKVRLTPGDILSVLSQTANTLTNTDLLIISAAHEPQVLAAAWYYVPRMLHKHSVVLHQVDGGADVPLQFVVKPRLEVERLAASACRPLRSAA